MIRVLAVALTTILGGGAQPAVCEVGKPAIPEAPSQMAFSNDVQDGRDGGRDDGRDQDYNGKYARPEEHALSSDEEDEKGEKEVKVQGKKSDQGDEDDVRPEVTSDVAINLPAPSTAAAGASLMAAASAATSSPVASPADASSTATDPAFSAPTAVPSATTPESANPSVVPRPAAEPAAVRPVPVAGSPDCAGQSRAGGLDGTRLADSIFSKVRNATTFAR
jgi:hypothetical protein